jgi:hypothetical protein
MSNCKIPFVTLHKHMARICLIMNGREKLASSQGEYKPTEEQL